MKLVSPTKKVISLSQAKKLITAYQANGQTVGVMSGSFDIMSGIHFKSLEQVRNKCDVLVVLLNSDQSIRLYKGKAKPILNCTERSYILAQSPFVSHIIIMDDVTPVSHLDTLKPNIFFNVSEWGADCIERKIVESYGGKIMNSDVTLDAAWNSSTSELITRIARSEEMKVGKAIFLDRDGVINDNKAGYLFRWEDMVFMPHLIPAFKAFIKAGYKLIIITNQSGIARGYYTERQMHTLHQKMKAHFKKEGVIISAIYHCPHGPNDGCACRKSGIGMLLKAATEQNLNLSKSWFIGDSETDIEAGRFANVKTVYIGDEKTYPKGAYRPNFFASTMKAAASCILPKK